MLVVLAAGPSGMLVMRPSTVHRAPAPLMVSEQQTFLSKVATGALASAVALQLAQPVPVAALTPVDAASLAAKEARAEVEAAEAEAAKAQAEAAAASAAQKAFESSTPRTSPSRARSIWATTRPMLPQSRRPGPRQG